MRRALRCVFTGATGILAVGAAFPHTGAPADCNATAGLNTANKSAAVAFQFDEPATILSTQDMDRVGLMFPDGMLGFVRQRGRDPDYVFGSAGSFGGVGGSAHLPTGSYTFSGALESFHPAYRKNGWPIWSLTSGRTQPSPDGADFDRDYAGGGPTYSVAMRNNGAMADDMCARAALSPIRSTTRRDILLQIYHGEYYPLAPKSMPAYGGSGMAISCDGGVTFEKIGQILAPHVSREEFLSAHGATGLWADGTMIEADGLAERGCATPAGGAQREQYYYLVFTDHNSPEERYTGLSIARVSADDLLKAIRQRRAPVFRKYYNPEGAPTFAANYFTEPGIGGRSTSILFTPGQYMNSPGVMYDAYMHRFVLFYQTNQKQVELRTSKNLISWSPPTTAFRLDAASSRRVYYPSAVGDGSDPQALDQMFYIYFVVRERTPGRFTNPQLLRERVSITR